MPPPWEFLYALCVVHYGPRRPCVRSCRQILCLLTAQAGYRQTDVRQTDRQTVVRQTDRQTVVRQTDRCETDRQTDSRETDRQTDRQTVVRQTDRQTDVRQTAGNAVSIAQRSLHNALTLDKR